MNGSRTRTHKWRWPFPWRTQVGLKVSGLFVAEDPCLIIPRRAHHGLEVVQQFVAESPNAASMTELSKLIESASKELGFEHYAIAHHIRFGRPSENVRLSNYPLEWLGILREEDKASDPILRAAERTSTGFRWEKVGQLIRITDKEQKRLRRAASHGLARGFTIPNHIPGETFGSCHFAVSGNRPFPDESLPAAQSLGCFAFEAARQLLATRSESSNSYVVPAPLTERQRDCLVFAAKGKSDSVIAQLLNIKPKTVNEHIEAAKRRYAVATRTQLVVKALFRSEICYSEVIE